MKYDFIAGSHDLELVRGVRVDDHGPLPLIATWLQFDVNAATLFEAKPLEFDTRSQCLDEPRSGWILNQEQIHRRWR
jgi:hypothetical protein